VKFCRFFFFFFFSVFFFCCWSLPQALSRGSFLLPSLYLRLSTQHNACPHLVKRIAACRPPQCDLTPRESLPCSPLCLKACESVKVRRFEWSLVELLALSPSSDGPDYRIERFQMLRESPVEQMRKPFFTLSILDGDG